MSETYELAALKRENTKKSARDTRADGRIPAVVYGPGVEPFSISVDASDGLRMYRRAGSSHIVELDIEGTKMPVLIHDVYIHPVQTKIDHMDFYAVDMNAKTTVHVPFKFVGESAAVKSLGGVFAIDHDNIEIRCLPKDIPAEIEVDISVMANLHDHILVKDLDIDTKKFEIMHISDETAVCSITGRGSADSTEAAEEPVMDTEEATA